MYASNSLYQVYNQLAATPEPLLRCFADALGHLGSPNLRGFNQTLVDLRGRARRDPAPERLEPARRPSSFLIEHARRTIADLKRAGRRPGEVEPADEHTCARVRAAPRTSCIVCAGGRAGSWSACLPGWGTKWTRSVTTVIDIP